MNILSAEREGEVREKLLGGWSLRLTAETCGVSKGTVQRIRNKLRKEGCRLPMVYICTCGEELPSHSIQDIMKHLKEVERRKKKAKVHYYAKHWVRQ